MHEFWKSDELEGREEVIIKMIYREISYDKEKRMELAQHIFQKRTLTSIH
jgi:hypothetical protein